MINLQIESNLSNINLDGVQAPTGKCIKRMTIVDGNLIAYYTDGTSANLGKVVGADGANGADGADGAPGIGVPSGGSDGQILKKASGENYDTTWGDGMTYVGEVNTYTDLPMYGTVGDVCRVKSETEMLGQKQYVVSSYGNSHLGMYGNAYAFQTEYSSEPLTEVVFKLLGAYSNGVYESKNISPTNTLYFGYQGNTYTVGNISSTQYEEYPNDYDGDGNTDYYYYFYRAFGASTTEAQNVSFYDNVTVWADNMSNVPDGDSIEQYATYAMVKYPCGTLFMWDRDRDRWVAISAESEIKSGVVATENIANGAITSAKLADNAVTSTKLASNSVTSAKISGSIPVSKGGTGKTSWTAYRIPYPSATTTFSQLAFPSVESVLTQKPSGAPYWTDLASIGAGGGSYKKIGYTDDCDYTVSSSSGGKAAFDTAIAAANDWDTILVMPGIYGCPYTTVDTNKTLTIAKNINFVGVGMPQIGFYIDVQNNSVFDFETGTWTYFEQYKTSFSGFVMGKVTCHGQYYGESAISSLNATDCAFVNYSSSTLLTLSGRYTNCIFYNYQIQATCYADDLYFNGCKMANVYFGDGLGYMYTIGCDIWLDATHASTSYGWFAKGCKVVFSGDPVIYSGAFTCYLEFLDVDFYGGLPFDSTTTSSYSAERCYQYSLGTVVV